MRWCDLPLALIKRRCIDSSLACRRAQARGSPRPSTRHSSLALSGSASPVWQSRFSCLAQLVCNEAQRRQPSCCQEQCRQLCCQLLDRACQPAPHPRRDRPCDLGYAAPPPARRSALPSCRRAHRTSRTNQRKARAAWRRPRIEPRHIPHRHGAHRATQPLHIASGARGRRPAFVVGELALH